MLDATDWQHLETIYNLLRQAKGEYESDINLQGLSNRRNLQEYLIPNDAAIPARQEATSLMKW